MRAIKEVEAFPPLLAVRGCVPKQLRKWLTIHIPSGKSSDIDEALLGIQVIILETFRKCWQEHSKHFYEICPKRRPQGGEPEEGDDYN